MNKISKAAKGTAEEVKPELKPLIEEAKKFKTAEEFIVGIEKQVKKVPLTGKDKQFISELFEVGDSDIFIAYKKTGKSIPIERKVIDEAGKVTGKFKTDTQEIDLRIFTMPKLEQNAANSFLISENTSKITNLDDLPKVLKSQLTELFNQAKPVEAL